MLLRSITRPARRARSSSLPILAALLAAGVARAQEAPTSAPAAGSEAATAPDQVTLVGDEGTYRPPLAVVTKSPEPLEIRIDGVLDEAGWADATVIDDFRQVDPIENGIPTEPTTARVMYDANALYIAFECTQRAARRIATTKQRDAGLGADDFVRIALGPFGDNRNGYEFEMNPAGARGDGLIQDNNRRIRDWDAIWYARTTTADDGWIAEFRIPFKSISFDENISTWRLNLERVVRQNNEVIRWSSPYLNRPITSIATAGELKTIDEINQGLGLDIKPYGTVNYRREHGEDREQLDFDAGFDVFYKVTPAITAALTVNTDFAETEVDDRRINLTRFPLFFPEKRDFFLQDAGVFRFGGINQNPLPFQSRRIGLSPSGETVDILGGLKVTGATDRYTLGLLSVQQKASRDVEEKNLSVARMSWNVLSESSIGVIATAGDPRTNGDNYVVGADFNFRDSNAFGNGQVLDGHLWFQQSFTPGDDRDGTDNSFGMKLGYPNDRINWQIGAAEIGDDFNAALGFVPRSGIREYFARTRYRWRPTGSFIRTIDVGLNAFLVTNLRNDIESQDLDFELLDITTDAGDSIDITYQRQREVLDRPFEIFDDVVIPAESYWFDRFSLSASTSANRPLRVSGGVTFGTFFDGDRVDYTGGVQWRPNESFFASVDYRMSDVDLEDGDFITRLASARMNVYFTPDVIWTSLIQYDNVSDSIGLNSRLRWIVQPGNDVFLVVNQGYRYEDNRIRSETTELTTKVGWTFRY